MRTVLLQGVRSVIGTFLAARLLQQEGTYLILLVAPDQLLSRPEAERRLLLALSLAGLTAGEVQEAQLLGRIRWLEYCGAEGCLSDWFADAPPEETWCVEEALTAGEAAGTVVFLEQLERIGVPEFNLVVGTIMMTPPPRSAGGASSKPGVRGAVELFGRDRRPFCRLFQASLTLDPSNVAELWQIPDVFGVSALLALRREVEGRVPEYFDYHAVRIALHKDAIVTLVRPEELVDAFLEGCVTPATKPATISDFCEMIAEVSGITLLLAPDEGELNEVDNLFQALLQGTRTIFSASSSRGDGSSIDGICCPRNDAAASQEAAFAGIAHAWNSGVEAERAFAHAVQELPHRFKRKTLVRGTSSFDYTIVGSKGPAVLILNALGQGLDYWHPLLVLLSEHYRLFLWKPRGLEEGEKGVRLDDHVEDTELIAREENLETYQLICWCTGPKVAIRLTLAHPDSVRRLVFLNSTFKGQGVQDDLETDYEQNLESLTRLLSGNPGMVGSVIRSLQALPEQGENNQVVDAEENDVDLPAKAMSSPNRALQANLVAPFRTETSTLQYVDQLLDFWAHDEIPSLRDLDVPILFIASENDLVASPEMSQMAFAQARLGIFKQLPKASHHSFYERPHSVAAHIHHFFASSSIHRTGLEIEENSERLSQETEHPPCR